MIYSLVIFLFSFATLQAITLNIENDSAYSLNAVIYSVDDHPLASFDISPSHSITWQDSFFGARDYSKGPFTVVFTCPSGDTFGKTTNVFTDSSVYASGSQGPKVCKSAQQSTP